ncbi:MAG: XRE family transcriptional regulator [Acidobacteria bacterium]|nr:XRE family transcriptional regulator [Acidobacteriota bacterium]
MNSKGSLAVLGTRIRDARKGLGISQEGLALHADIDRSFMGQVERGQRNVSFITLCKIASVLKTDLGVLCGGLPMEDIITPETK